MKKHTLAYYGNYKTWNKSFPIIPIKQTQQKHNTNNLLSTYIIIPWSIHPYKINNIYGYTHSKQFDNHIIILDILFSFIIFEPNSSIIEELKFETGYPITLISFDVL